MTAKTIYPYVKKRAGQPAQLKNNPRVRVAQIVMDYRLHAWTAEEFCQHYPHLQPAEVHAALTYYYDHQNEIDQELETEKEEVKKMKARGHTSPFFQRLKKKR